MVRIVLRSWVRARAACATARALGAALLATFPLAGGSVQAWGEPRVAQDSITFGQAAAVTESAAALGLQVRTRTSRSIATLKELRG